MIIINEQHRNGDIKQMMVKHNTTNHVEAWYRHVIYSHPQLKDIPVINAYFKDGTYILKLDGDKDLVS